MELLHNWPVGSSPTPNPTNHPPTLDFQIFTALFLFKLVGARGRNTQCLEATVALPGSPDGNWSDVTPGAAPVWRNARRRSFALLPQLSPHGRVGGGTLLWFSQCDDTQGWKSTPVPAGKRGKLIGNMAQPVNKSKYINNLYSSHRRAPDIQNKTQGK